MSSQPTKPPRGVKYEKESVSLRLIDGKWIKFVNLWCTSSSLLKIGVKSSEVNGKNAIEFSSLKVGVCLSKCQIVRRCFGAEVQAVSAKESVRYCRDNLNAPTWLTDWHFFAEWKWAAGESDQNIGRQRDKWGTSAREIENRERVQENRSKTKRFGR